MEAPRKMGALFLAVLFACEACAPRSFSAPENKSAGGENRLSVPYYCQYNNTFQAEDSSGTTSLAMVLGHYGKSVTPDSMFQDIGKLNSLEALKVAAKHYGFDAIVSRSTMITQMQAEIDAGRPLILAADFASEGGHFVVVTGYDSKGFWVNDPAGYWDEVSFSPQGGYAAIQQCPSATGHGRHYSYKAVVRAFDRGRGSDGMGWVLYVKKRI
jgi:hypothetical protein